MMRLDKFLATLGLGSRKEVKKLITSGQIQVNDVTVTKVNHGVDEDHDQVAYLGQELVYQAYYYVMLNKPDGLVSATEDKMHETVIDWVALDFDHVDLFPVGRLDIDTTGLLLLTNNGQLAHQLLSPKKHVAKTYQALVTGQVSEVDIAAFAAGIHLKDFTAQAAELEILDYDPDKDQSLTKVTIHEGKFHQVKRMFLARDHEVLHLHRVSMGPLDLDPDLDLGQYRELTAAECDLLRPYGLE